MKYLLFTTLLLILTLTNLFSQEWKVVDRRYDIPDGLVDSYYWSIKCADSNNCMLLCRLWGAGGYYLRRTTDGGRTWKNVYMDSGWCYIEENKFKFVPEIISIAYPNEKLFLAVGDSGLVLRSTDKGETWKRDSLGKDLKLSDLKMVDENYGIATFSCYSKVKPSAFFETTDGGITWNDMNLSRKLLYSRGKDLVNKNLIMLYGTMQDTSFKGCYLFHFDTDWNLLDTLPIPDSVSIANAICYLDFKNENEGWICGSVRFDVIGVGYTYKSKIIHTSDGGRSWDIQWDSICHGARFYGIDFYDNQLGVVAAENGILLMTTNGGKEWKDIVLEKTIPYSGRFYDFQSPEVASPTTAYIIYENDSVFKYQRYPTDVKELPTENDPLCKVTLETNNSQNEFTINLDCEHKGNISFKLYDLLGNVVYIKDVYKNSNLLTVPINSKFRSGVYFLSVTLDDKFLYYNKIVITN